MSWLFDSQTPLFMQIAKAIEDDIFALIYKEEEQIPSTTQVSTTYHLNPATVLKGYNLLVEYDLIEKRRGMGLYVKKGAVEKIKIKRSQEFISSFITPLIKEAKKLGIDKKDLIKLIEDNNNEINC
jgi:GntR family transcriptional regulator